MAPTFKTNPTRCFQRYTTNERSDIGASHSQGYRQRQRVGEFFYTHPAIPGIAFRTAADAKRAARTRPFVLSAGAS